MKNVIIIGTGAVAAEITANMELAQYLCDGEPVQLKGYLEFDYNIDKYYKVYEFSAPVLGDIDTYTPVVNDCFVVGIADAVFRKKMIEKMEAKGGEFINLIHPTCIVAKTAHLGKGNILSSYCLIGPKAVVGDFNLLTSYSAISHDCVVGSNNSFSSVIICGHAKIGNDNQFYIRSTVQPWVEVGSNCIIQAGMMIDKNVPDATTVFYRFKEKIIAVPKEL